jgi:type VI protein secretion system component VasK
MTFSRIALSVGVVVIAAFMIIVAIGINGAISPIIALLALGGLIACGNLLYGKHSHGATATARKRPAQQAQNQAIDEAQRQAQLERQQARQARSTRRRSRSRSNSGGTS